MVCDCEILGLKRSDSEHQKRGGDFQNTNSSWSHQSTTNEVEGKQVVLDTELKSWSLVSDFQLPLLLNFNSYLLLALLFPCLDNEENLAMSFT